MRAVPRAGGAGKRRAGPRCPVRRGTRIRLLLGDPAGAQLAARDREHKISGGVAGRAAAVPGYYRQMPEAVELRLHDTPLYNSVYRLDDEMLVNVHA